MPIEWSKQYIETLRGEDHRVEWKGSRIFEDVLNGNGLDFREKLAKQLSAFSNTGGGAIILGVSNDGKIDPGVPLFLKGRQPTREWLETVIPLLTSPEILGFRVVEIPHDRENGVLVIEVPDSERAPHQSSRDHKYYVRSGSSSRPADDQIIRDIRNRLQHPVIEATAVSVTNAQPQFTGAYHANPFIRTRLRFTVSNVGRLRAANVCLAIESPLNFGARAEDLDEAVVRYGAPNGMTLLEFKHSVYPGMEVSISATFPVYVLPYKAIMGSGSLRIPFAITVFADSAPPRKKEFAAHEIPGWESITNLVL